MFIKFNGVNKSFGSKENRVGVLKEISTDIEKGEICSILGPSGSGKSTFLNILGGLDRIDAGMIKVANYNIGDLKYKGLADYRRDFLGFVFQFYNLVPNLTVYENIQVCQYLSKSPLDIDELLETLNMSEHADKYPSQISGGQQQRCAIARALVKNPLILLCDEPTGALDSKSAKDIFVLLEAVNRKYSTTIVIVSHNELVEMSDHVIRLKDGKIVYDKKNDSKICAADIEW